MEAEERRVAGTPGGSAEAAPGGDGGRSVRADEPTPSDPRALDANERCAHHGGRPAVARCDACGEPVCLACATPVRGRVLGPGCIAEELGDPALVTSPEPDRDRSWVAVAGAVLAVAGTAAPWTRTGAGDRVFGAWVPTPRWSMLAAVAAIALVAVAWTWAGRPASRPISLALAVLTVVGAVLAIVFPPTFQAASWGPWITATGGGGAAIVIATTGARARARDRGV